MFRDQMLIRIGNPQELIPLVMVYVNNTHWMILWHGNTGDGSSGKMKTLWAAWRSGIIKKNF